jgi:hypothetical protein
MVKATVVKKIQRSCRVLLLLKARIKVDLARICDGQGERGTRVMEQEGLVCLWNCEVNVNLLDSPATMNRHTSKWRLQYHKHFLKYCFMLSTSSYLMLTGLDPS